MESRKRLLSHSKPPDADIKPKIVPVSVNNTSTSTVTTKTTGDSVMSIDKEAKTVNVETSSSSETPVSRSDVKDTLKSMGLRCEDFTISVYSKEQAHAILRKQGVEVTNHGSNNDNKQSNKANNQTKPANRPVNNSSVNGTYRNNTNQSQQSNRPNNQSQSSNRSNQNKSSNKRTEDDEDDDDCVILDSPPAIKAPSSVPSNHQNVNMKKSQNVNISMNKNPNLTKNHNITPNLNISRSVHVRGVSQVNILVYSLFFLFSFSFIF